ncbi:MAG: tail fiber domain-containing protein [Ignavibacteriaceae bacterium]|jgi:hypothetical protein
MKHYLFVTVIFFSFLFASKSIAQIPRLISYQGIISDTLGSPSPDGGATFTFRLYNSETGGTPLWMEVKSLYIKRGLFYTFLGEQTPFNDSMKFDKSYWLSVQVGNQQETVPRILLSSVAYSINSYHSLNSDTANAIMNNSIYTSNIVDGEVKTDDIADEAITQNKIAVGTSISPGGNAGGDLTGSYPNPSVVKLQGVSINASLPSAGQVLKYDGTKWSPVNQPIVTCNTANYIPKIENSSSTLTCSQILDDGNNVGIGTILPLEKLHIVGRYKQDQPYNGTSYLMNITGGANGLYINHSGSSGTPLQINQSNSATSSNSIIIVNEGTGRTMEIQQNNNSNLNSMIYIAKSGTGKVIDVTNGAFLSNAGVWTNASDFNAKENFEFIDGEQILASIEKLDVTRWNYKSDKSNIKHIGPVAQDFYKLFGLGENDKSISTIDPSGIAIVAIKELHQQNKVLSKEITELKQLVKNLLTKKVGIEK